MNLEMLKAAVRSAAPPGYTPQCHWLYRDAAGEDVMAVARFNLVQRNGSERPKQFRPFIADGNGGFVSTFPDPRPLYHLDEIVLKPDAVVIVVEGEKAADEAAKLFPDFVCTTSAGGSLAATKTDWEPLNGRLVYLWPDNDEGGGKYAAAVSALLPQVCVVVPPNWLPEKWDLADDIPAGKTIDDIAALLAEAKPLTPKTGPEALASSLRKAVPPPTKVLVSKCAADIEPEQISWLWDGRLARGKHTCIAGEPGTGKSQVSISIIAAITTGGTWPCGEGNAPSERGSVIILNAEDGGADTIVPRLMAAGADRGKVHIVSAVRSDDGRRSFNLQADLELLEELIAKIGDVVLIVIDPISSYLDKTDSHKNAEVRGVLEPVGEMAERLRVAVLSVTHFSKAGMGSTTKALHKFIGSIAFVGAPRAAFAVIEDAEDSTRRLFLHAKNNLAPPPQGLAFGLEQTNIGSIGLFASRVKWELDPVDMTADVALADTGSEKGAPRGEAKAFLRQMLADGPVDVDAVNAQADKLGIAKRTLARARADLAVDATKGSFGGGPWMLSLPEGCHITPKGAT